MSQHIKRQKQNHYQPTATASSSSSTMTTTIAKPQASPKSNSSIHSLFTELTALLDIRYDKREQLITLSRDITRNSKKVISMLQRTGTGTGSGSDMNDRNTQQLINDAEKQLHHVRQQILSISSICTTRDELWMYHYNYSPAIQEYVEAVTFLHYIMTNELISLGAINKQLYDTAATASKKQQRSAESKSSHETATVPGQQQQVQAQAQAQGRPTQDEQERHDASSTVRSAVLEIHPSDYILGVFDLSGELMRRATNTLATSNNPNHIVDAVTEFLRDLKAQLYGLRVPIKGFMSKLDAFTQSVNKLETLGYKLQLREAEGLSFDSRYVDLIRSHGNDTDRGEREREHERVPAEC
jgi:predicted translin family RNA/ssDNA-binding protein